MSRGDARAASNAGLVKLVAVGLAVGFFGAFFGVGGGLIMVPLFILWFQLDAKTATGTSLLAVAIMAPAAVASHSAVGQVDYATGILLGIPAVVGTFLGVALQQRFSSQRLSLVFGIFMVAVATSVALGIR